jgi:hypothetical protein
MPRPEVLVERRYVDFKRLCSSLCRSHLAAAGI